MRLSEYKSGTILVDGDGKVFIHDGFVSATWNNEDDCYDTCYKQGDDYCRGVSGLMLGPEIFCSKFTLPNTPTHWMKMLTHP